MILPSDLPEDDAILAAELALGLLDGDEARSAEARALTEPAFAQEVTFWQARLADLASDVAPVQPSAAARRQLLARVFGQEQKQGWLARAGFWQATAAASLALAAVLGYEVATQVRVPTLYATVLTSEDGALRVLAVYDSVTGHIRVTRTDGSAAPGRDLELWAIADGEAPVPVGLLPDDAARAGYEVPEAVRTALEGLTLAISDEPDGGSPTGQPTGEILSAAGVEEI